jgi:hypothetical protein
MLIGATDPNGSISGMGREAWEALLKIFPGAANHLYVDGIKSEWSDEKFLDHIEKCTENMCAVPGVPRPRCQADVNAQKNIQNIMQEQIDGGNLSNNWWCDNEDDDPSPSGRWNLEQRIANFVGKANSFDSPQALAQGKYDKALAECQKNSGRKDDMQKKYDEAAKEFADAESSDGPDPEKILVTADADREKSAEDLLAAKEAVKDANANLKEATAAKTTAKKNQTTAKTAAKKAADALKKGKGDEAELQAAVDESERLLIEADEEVPKTEEAEKDAKQAVADAKAAEKEATEVSKAAIKAAQDAKKGVSSAESGLKKLKGNLEAAQKNLDGATLKVKQDEDKMAQHQAILNEMIAKQDAANKQVKIFEDRKQRNLDAIEAARIEIDRICAAARPAEIESLMNEYKAARDDLCNQLIAPMRKADAIDKLRQDRIDTHGQSELDRRVGEQKRIQGLKQAENNRRDQVPRTCNLCKRVVGNRSAAESHSETSAKHAKCDVVIRWYTTDNSKDCPSPSYTTPENVNHLRLDPMALDSALWGTYEKKSDNELALYPFHTDVATNPYGGWHAGFGGEYLQNNVKMDPKAGAPKADDAVVALAGTSLAPNPATSDPSIYDVSGKTWEGGITMFTRRDLQYGSATGPDDLPDRTRFLSGEHKWWSKITRNLLPNTKN